MFLVINETLVYKMMIFQKGRIFQVPNDDETQGGYCCKACLPFEEPEKIESLEDDDEKVFVPCHIAEEAEGWEEAIEISQELSES